MQGCFCSMLDFWGKKRKARSPWWHSRHSIRSQQYLKLTISFYTAKDTHPQQACLIFWMLMDNCQRYTLTQCGTAFCLWAKMRAQLFSLFDWCSPTLYDLDHYWSGIRIGSKRRLHVLPELHTCAQWCSTVLRRKLSSSQRISFNPW